MGQHLVLIHHLHHVKAPAQSWELPFFKAVLGWCGVRVLTGKTTGAATMIIHHMGGSENGVPPKKWQVDIDNDDFTVCQNLVPLVNIKIAGKWMFIPLKMVLIGIDPYPFHSGWGTLFSNKQPRVDKSSPVTRIASDKDSSISSDFSCTKSAVFIKRYSFSSPTDGNLRCYTWI